MPELGEVEYYRKVWNPGLNQPILRVHLHADKRVFRGCDTAELAQRLQNAHLVESKAHGKQMMFRTNPDGWLGIHLGMSGKLQCGNPAMVPARHDHFVLFTPSAALVFNDARMFGRISFHAGPHPPACWANRPPAIHSLAFDATYLDRILNRFHRSKLKPLLLNQDHFPGIGNWMADEVLWRAGIHPESIAGKLSPIKSRNLLKYLKEVCADALRVVGNGWQTPPDSWLFNHRWKTGGRCPATGKPLEHIKVNGRTTCFSPARQPLEDT